MSIYRAPDFKDLEECISLTDTARCSRLRLRYCQGSDCPFRKTTEQVLRSRKESDLRLRNLDVSVQKHIAKKYFKGSMPWKTVEEI